MAIIETKFSIGDIVYKGDSNYETDYINCPDCLGTKVVHITFADKRVEELACYTCRTYRYPEHSIGYLEVKTWKPRVRKGRIFAVEFCDGRATYKVNYGWTSYKGEGYDDICHHDECHLYSNEEDALSEATQQVERRTASELKDTFKKKGSFANRLEESYLGYSRKRALEEERNMNRWLKTINGE